MYADTPPTLIAVPPSLSGSTTGLSRAADLIDLELRRRPVWVVVATPPGPARGDARHAATIQALADEPAAEPEGPPATWLGWALQQHLARRGIHLPLASPLDAKVPRISAISTSPWDGRQVEALEHEASLVGTAGPLVLGPAR